MFNRLLALLQIRPDEAGLALQVAGLFALIELARGMGGSAADALFFLRFGVEFLPYLYIALGLVTFVVSLSYAAFLGSAARLRLFTTLLLGMAAVLLAERAAILLNLRALYPVLWLSVNIIGSLLGTIVWTIAGEACETRQAKRLFPIFISAGILGGLVGSLIIGPAARLLGTENLLIIYALLLGLGLLLVRSIAALHLQAVDHAAEGPSFLADIRVGFDTVRRTPLLQRLALSAVLFSVLYFSVSFPFGKAVSASFSSEADLAGFLGLFSGVTSALMFMVALLLANRLYSRIGIVNSLLILPVTYLLGFVLFAVHFALPTAVIVRLSQLVVMSGIGDGAYNTFFNVVPLEKRAQVRAFDSGVPSQLGTILSGVLLILGERVLSNAAIFGMAMLVAAACGVLVWTMRGSYVAALLAALRTGRYEVFTAGEHIFNGFRQDPNAIRVVTAALDDPRPTMRKLAAEILVKMEVRSAAPQLIRRLADASGDDEKVTFIRALGDLGAAEAAGSIAPLLADPSPSVRLASLEALPKLSQSVGPALRRLVQPLLSDLDSGVRVQAVVSLGRIEKDGTAIQRLAELLDDADPERRLIALQGIETLLNDDFPSSQNGLDTVLIAAAACLADGTAAVREAACRIFRFSTGEWPQRLLVGRLGDAEPSVRMAAAHALKAAGPAAYSSVLAALSTDAVDHAAALEALPPNDPTIHVPLCDYAYAEIDRLRQLRDLAGMTPVTGRVTKFLASMLQTKAWLHEQHLAKALGLIGNQEAMRLVAESLHTEDAQARSAALETLDVLGDPQLVKALLPLIEDPADQRERGMETEGKFEAAFGYLTSQGDQWLRALAIRAAGELKMRALVPDLYAFEANPDRIISGAARDALIQLGEKMDTLDTMTLMERVLLLKEVPLFEDLSPDDLERIAEIAGERWFSDGEIVCREGEIGHELFIVAQGSVRVSRQTGGEEITLAARGVGEFVGEMSIIDSAPRFATVAADGEARTLVITAEAFKAILRDRPEVSMAVMRGLSRRLRERG